MGLSGSDVYLNILPLFHIGGLIAAFTTMHAGGLNVIVSKFDPEECVRLIDERKVTIIGVPDPKFGERIKAVCVVKTGSGLTKQGLIDFVAARIARYKKPNYVEFVESLPKKEDGSIDRARVKELYG